MGSVDCEEIERYLYPIYILKIHVQMPMCIWGCVKTYMILKTTNVNERFVVQLIPDHSLAKGLYRFGHHILNQCPNITQPAMNLPIELLEVVFSIRIFIHALSVHPITYDYRMPSAAGLGAGGGDRAHLLACSVT